MRAVEQSMFPDLRSDKAVGPLVPSVIAGTNADLMAKVRHLGYLNGTVLDTTYGRGGWWTTHRPPGLVHTIADFRALPHPDQSIDTVCYDPPYIRCGGTETSTRRDFQDRFGLHDGRGLAELRALMLAGLTECARVTRRFVLVKCMDFLDGGRFTFMSHTVVDHALNVGLVVHDEIVHHSGSGPGGHNIVNQLRARRHHSKLLVFTKEVRTS